MLFPVIAWYDIILTAEQIRDEGLLFPVIAWYDIIINVSTSFSGMLLFPVIAWYDIILRRAWRAFTSCCSQLSLGMI